DAPPVRWQEVTVPARDPLIEHLIRNTAPRSSVSALPQRAGGTRSRAGNAMARTRAGLLDGALRAVCKHGTRRTTMHDIAALGGDDVVLRWLSSYVAAPARPGPIRTAAEALVRGLPPAPLAETGRETAS